MAGYLLVKPGRDWIVQGGLFDWTVAFLMARVCDPGVVERLREIAENNLQSLWLTDFPVDVQEEIWRCLRGELLDVARRDLQASDTTLERLQELVDLTCAPPQQAR